MNNSQATVCDNTAKKSLVPNNRRASAISQHFGSSCVLVEHKVYQILDMIAEGYTGGYFDFYELHGGGFYFSLRSDKTFHVEIPFGNGFSGLLSSEATSIVACLFAYSALAEMDEKFIDYFHSLRNFASNHEEYSSILGAID